MTMVSASLFALALSLIAAAIISRTSAKPIEKGVASILTATLILGVSLVSFNLGGNGKAGYPEELSFKMDRKVYSVKSKPIILNGRKAVILREIDIATREPIEGKDERFYDIEETFLPADAPLVIAIKEPCIDGTERINFHSLLLTPVNPVNKKEADEAKPKG